MKKILAILLAVLLIAGMAIPAFAVTPQMNVPDMPEVSKVKFDIKLDKNLDKAIESYVAEWVKKIDSFKIKLPHFGG